MYESTNAHLVTNAVRADTTNDLVVSTVIAPVNFKHNGVSNLKHIYRYVRSHIIILQQHVSVTSVTIIKASYNKNTIKPFNSRRSDCPLNFNRQRAQFYIVRYITEVCSNTRSRKPKEMSSKRMSQCVCYILRIYVHVFIHICVYVCVCVCVCVCVGVFVCVCVCGCVCLHP